MGIKGILGFCECKACKNRAEYDMDITVHSSNGLKKTKTVRICGKCAMEQLKNAELKSVTVEHIIDL